MIDRNSTGTTTPVPTASTTAATVRAPRRRKQSASLQSSPGIRIHSKSLRTLVHLILAGIALTAFAPFLIIVSSSLTSEQSLVVDGFAIWPRGVDTTAYQLIFERPERLYSAYRVTIFVSVLGTFLALLFMSMIAYPMSRPQFRYRRFFNLFVLIPMLFNGGIVPYYILVTQYLGLRNTLTILFLPPMISFYQIILLRAFFVQIPNEMFDAARADGAGEWRILFTIVVHLAKPAIATMALMTFLSYWNNWTTALYFIDQWELYPLQYLLNQLMRDAEALALEPQVGGQALPTNAVRMAMAVLATGPAAAIFLAFQKYLVQGITLGSLK